MRIDSLNSFFIYVKKELIIYNSVLLSEFNETGPSILVYSNSAIPKHLFNNLLNNWIGENSSFGNLLEHLEQEFTISSNSC